VYIVHSTYYIIYIIYIHVWMYMTYYIHANALFFFSSSSVLLSSHFSSSSYLLLSPPDPRPSSPPSPSFIHAHEPVLIFSLTSFTFKSASLSKHCLTPGRFVNGPIYGMFLAHDNNIGKKL
jgi:hypothetical protein